MHELSFAQQILENVEREARNYPGCRVVRIRLRAGEMLALDPASLRFAMEAISVDTAAEGAVVEMDEVTQQLECPRCGTVPAEAPLGTRCPECGGEGTLTAATELTIEEIELDDEDGET